MGALQTMTRDELIFIVIMLIVSIIGVFHSVKAECTYSCPAFDENNKPYDYCCDEKDNNFCYTYDDKCLTDSSKEYIGSQLEKMMMDTDPSCNENGLLLYYPLDSDATDYACGYDLTISGATNVPYECVNYTDTGGYYTFDGIDDRMNITDIPILPYGNMNRSISLWFKLNDFEDSVNEFMIGYGQTTKTGQLFGLALFTTNDVGISGQAMDCGSVILKTTDKSWHHMVGIYNGTHEIIYLNGVYNASCNYTNPLNTTANNFRIGDRYTNDRQFNGSLDEIRFYNKSLSAAEVLAIFNEESDLSCGFVADPWHEYNETLGSYWINQTVNENNSLLTQIKGDLEMIAYVLLWLGLWAFGYYATQNYNELLGFTMIILTLPIDLYFSYAFQESLRLATGYMGIAFAIMAAWTIGILLHIRRKTRLVL